jgi:hypothetical protein
MVDQITDTSQLPPIKLAFIIDGEVADILHTDERLAAIFTSQPLVMDVTEKMQTTSIQVGYSYNAETQEFIEPPAYPTTEGQ